MALVLAPVALSAAPAEPTRALLDLTGALDRTFALPLGAPVPADASGLGPGTLLFIEQPDATYACTANFLWRGNGALYLGAAGHCFLPEDRTSTHGPGADADVSKVRVEACVQSCRFGGQTGFLFHGTTVELGPVVYARQQDASGYGVGHDFGLVRIPDAHLALARSSMPVWGAMETSGPLRAGDITCHYGNAVGFGEAYLTKARTGTGITTLPDGSWRAAIPSNQGDSGSAVATCTAGADGLDAARAVGLLTHLTATGVAGTTMARAQAMAAEAGLAVTPVLG